MKNQVPSPAQRVVNLVTKELLDPVSNILKFTTPGNPTQYPIIVCDIIYFTLHPSCDAHLFKRHTGSIKEELLALTNKQTSTGDTNEFLDDWNAATQDFIEDSAPDTIFDVEDDYEIGAGLNTVCYRTYSFLDSDIAIEFLKPRVCRVISKAMESINTH